MTNFLQKYKSFIGQLNYILFLVTVALLPFPQLALRYAIVAWFATWVFEGRFLSKPMRQDWHKSIPFLMFGTWYLWKIISGLWAANIDDYGWQLERYLFFGLLVPVGIWGVNARYDWKQICKVLAIACVAAAALYTFTLFWVINANTFYSEIGNDYFAPIPFDFFEEKIKEIDITPYGKEGFSMADWVLLDYSDVVLHVFTPESREFFNIEKLWADAKEVDISDILDIKKD